MRYRPRHLLIFGLFILLSGLRSAATQDELPLGHLQVAISAGYGGYALPVANSALARQWASGTGLAWQAGYNYSTIPIRVDIEHREAMALRGRVEVMAEHGFAAEESPVSHPIVVSREFSVPPSIPSSLVLLPRVCPPSVPGAPVQLEVRIYLGDNLRPYFVDTVEAAQLEPAHLYALYLDGPPGLICRDVANAGNHLELLPPVGARSGELRLTPEILDSYIYTLACDRRQLALAPLAARDFAFVTADLEQLRSWPAEAQQGLLTFVLGGGYLCLFNAGGSWQGLDLTAPAQPLGRGYVLATAGGFSEARAEMTRWVEGELSEFVLLAGGTIHGWQPQVLLNANPLSRVRELFALLAPPSEQERILSHQPGYLHPVWIYRETCRHAALEPWDYPEFNSTEQELFANNTNLRVLREDPNEPDQPLAHYAVASRRWPVALVWPAVGLPLVLALPGILVRRRGYALALALLAVAASGCLWWQTTPQLVPPLRMALFDAVPGSQTAVRRDLTMIHADRSGRLGAALPENALVRRVSWTLPSSWQLASTGAASRWQGNQQGSLAVVATDAPTVAPQSPVAVTARRLNSSTVELLIDTSSMTQDAACYLLTATGWLVLPGGQPTIRVELAAPTAGVSPGAARLAAWDGYFAHRLRDERRSFSPIDISTTAVLKQLAAAPGGDGSEADVARLGWLGLAQNPTGLRGLLNNQAVIFARDSQGSAALSGQERAVGFLRLAIPLDAPDHSGEGAP